MTLIVRIVQRILAVIEKGSKYMAKKHIPLTRGEFAIIDEEDFEYLNQFKWYCSKDGYAS